MLEAGRRLGHYVIESLLGSGGMGDVYLARDTNLGRAVAIKTLRADFEADPERLGRFEREARLLASLSHPNVASVHGFEQSESLRYLVLEHVEGPTLEQRLTSGALPIREALAIAEGIARALEAAHAAGIVHRDLKPANIKVKPDDSVKVLDFGLAKALTPTADEPANSPTVTAGATRAGMLLGTAAYMSPEQARGRAVDQRTDLWAFGCVFYEMITGRQAFGGETISDSLAHVLHREVDWSLLPNETPRSARRLLRRCLERDIKRRQQSAGDARLELEDGLSGTSEVGVREPTGGRASRRAWLVASIAVAGLLMSFGWMAFGAGRATSRTIDPQPVHFTASLPAGMTLKRNLPFYALAPDGQSIAVVAADPNNLTATGHLEMRSLGQLEFQRVPGSEFATNPFFLNDPLRVGFVDEKTFELKTIEIGSGSRRTLCVLGSAGVVGATSGPDGSIILSHSSSGRPAALKRVATSGGAPTVILEPSPALHERDFNNPEALGDGEHVMFTIAFDDGRYAIDLLSLKTGERRRLVENALGGRIGRSGYLVYFRINGTGSINGDLVAASFDRSTLSVGERAITLVSGTQHAALTAGRGIDAVIGGDTLMILRPSSESQARSLVWIESNGAAASIGATARQYRQPDLSADGKRLALQLDDENRDIVVYDLARDIASNVTRSPAEQETARWSPDGTRLAYVSRHNGKDQVFVTRPDAGANEELLWTFDGHTHLTSWQADGQRLYMNVRGATEDVWTYSFADKTAKPFLRTKANEYGAEPSPDGRWVAYVSEESAQPEVYLADSGGSRRAQVSRDGGSEPVWSSDGGRLFFRKLETSTVWVVPVATGAELRLGAPTTFLTAPFMAGARDRAYDIGPDGRFLVVRPKSDGSEHPIEVIANFSSEFNRLSSESRR